jgi:dienelactone hydrolase
MTRMVARVALAAVLSWGMVMPASAQGFSGLFGAPSGRMSAFQVDGHCVRVESFASNSRCLSPAIVMLYGMDGMTKYGTQMRMAASQLAANGYAPFIIYYFDGPGGRLTDDNIDSVKEENFHAWVRTARAGISWVQQQPGVDPTRIGITGFSLGSSVGLATSALDARVDVVIDAFGALPVPFEKYAGNMPPTLILHGQCDEYVPVDAAYRLNSLLSRKGVPNRIIVYAGEKHTFSTRTSRDAAARGLAFLNAYLK